MVRCRCRCINQHRPGISLAHDNCLLHLQSLQHHSQHGTEKQKGFILTHIPSAHEAVSNTTPVSTRMTWLRRTPLLGITSLDVDLCLPLTFRAQGKGSQVQPARPAPRFPGPRRREQVAPTGDAWQPGLTPGRGSTPRTPVSPVFLVLSLNGLRSGLPRAREAVPRGPGVRTRTGVRRTLTRKRRVGSWLHADACARARRDNKVPPSPGDRGPACDGPVVLEPGTRSILAHARPVTLVRRTGTTTDPNRRRRQQCVKGANKGLPLWHKLRNSCEAPVHVPSVSLASPRTGHPAPSLAETGRARLTDSPTAPWCIRQRVEQPHARLLQGKARSR